MAAEVGAANIRIGASIAGLLDGMRQASAAVRTATLDINSKLVDSYKRASKEQAVFRGGLTKLGDELTGIGTKLQLFTTLPALFAIGKSFKDFAELQKLEKGLNRYGESLENVRELAKLPNIGIFDGARSLISLKAMKVNSDLATRSIKAFANAITDAGGSAVDLEPAMINLRQFIATKHINQVDLRQLSARMPQTNDAMQSAFGTQDVEKLNEKMGSMGVTKFIEKFIAELEKLPKAGGGAATAMEQLGDSATFFSAAIGEGGDKAFDITGKISGLGGVLDNLSTNFKSLTPEAQKSVFALGAAAVVIPTVITAVGGLIKLWPLLTAGFGLVATTVGAPVAAILGIAAAVGVAAAAIITNWDSIKSFLVETSWWNTLIGGAKSALGVLGELFKVVINLIQGDWDNFGKAVVNVFKNISNLVVTSIGATLKAITGIFSSAALGLFAIFDKDISGSDLYKGINSAVGSIDGLVNKFKFDVPDSFGMARGAIKTVKDVVTGTTPEIKLLGDEAKDTGGKFEKLGEQLSYFAQETKNIKSSMRWKEEQNELTATIKAYKELYGVVAGLNVERLKIGGSTLGGSTFAGLESGKGKVAAIAEQKMEGTLSEANKGSLKFYSEYNTQLAASVKLQEAFGASLDLGKARQYFSGLPKLAGESADQYAERLNSIVEVSARLSDSLSDALKNAASETAYAFGELIGNLMSGAGGIEDFGKRVLGSLASMLKDMGKSLIAAGTAGIALKVFGKNPALALASGIALVALGTLTQNKISRQAGEATTRFAKGGFAYGEMNAIVGDNPNSRFDPEMIAPYSKVDRSIKQSIKESGGGYGGVYIPELKLRGEDLYVAFKRVEANNKALGR
jgi:tape measure domain-containing protein